MEIEQNTISRDWTVLHQGRRFYVNFTESDGQTLALCNRENWDIQEEAEDGTDELNVYVLSNSSLEEREQAEENAGVMDKLIAYCIRNWDNVFMKELKRDLEEQRKRLE
jgi:hypothetical protein